MSGVVVDAVVLIHLLDQLRLLFEDLFQELSEQHRCVPSKRSYDAHNNSGGQAPKSPFHPEIALLPH